MPTVWSTLWVSWLALLLSGPVGVVLSSSIARGREGCFQILTCSGEASSPPEWRKRGETGGSSCGVTEEVTNETLSEDPSMYFWQSSMIFKALQMRDTGSYSCTIGSSTLAITLIVMEGKMGVKLNTTVSDGVRLLQCYVETCLQDTVVQFFRGRHLLESTSDRVEKGLVGTLKLNPEEAVSGSYVCRAMSDSANVVVHKSISLT